MEAASLFVHISAGSLAVVAGYIAIFATKGGGLHRRSGLVFVYAMIVMGMAALAVAIIRDLPHLLLGGPTAAYFAITALTTVRPVGRRLDAALIVVPLTMSTLSFVTVAETLGQGRTTTPGGTPIAMVVFLATVALLAALSDIRRLRGAVSAGAGRIARHLWRMCFGFWIATGSFFLGQMDEFPAWLQRPALLAVPALLPLVLMLYWLWRVRVRRALAGMVLRQA